MLIRRGVNIVVILAFLVLLILNMTTIFEVAGQEYYILAGIILIVPLYFLFREIRLWYFQSRIILLHINHSVIILMVILAGLSYYMYYLFDISSMPEFSAFYLISTFLLPVLGIISSDQYIFIRKKHIVFNIDKRLKVKLSEFESIKLENRHIKVKYAEKEKLLRLGRDESKYPELVNELSEKIDTLQY
ncbi:MAG: hypothetical protein C0592_10050 [Marinilabiliales bacterium]|nr:MAG: hypothetical protein C0592_10050 [Marinilabiliales bacterium]